MCIYWGFPGGASGKEPACQCRRHKRLRFNLWIGKIPWRGHGDPIKYSCLENPMDRASWQATAHGVTYTRVLACQEICISYFQFSSVQLLSCVQLFATPWTAACQASLSITNSRNLPKLMSIESVMPSNHLIFCHPLLPPSIFPSIRVFSNKSALCITWPKYWSFSFNISPSNEHPGLISFRMDWLDLLAVAGTLKSLFQYHSSKASILQRSAFFRVQL